MYIKKIIKDNNVYYILSVCDVKTGVWSSVFIREKIANILVTECGIKLISN